jgi:ABC-type multidrug transport system fused ATPase/permease subunit
MPLVYSVRYLLSFFKPSCWLSNDHDANIFSVFQYMLCFGSPLYAVICLILMFVSVVASIVGALWLAIWVEAYSQEGTIDIAYYLGVYAVLTFAESIMYGVVFLSMENGAWLAARRIHTQFITAVMGAPLSWFNSVPIGRVVNRFSRDMASVDQYICGLLRMFLESVMVLFLRIAAISSILPVFMLPAIVTCGLGVLAGEMYTRTAVTVRRLVSSAQSPIFTQFSDTLAGLAVIRARDGMPDTFGDLLAERLRLWSRAAESNYNCNRWVAMRVDAITAAVTVCAGIIAVSKAGSVTAGLVGFSLTNATSLSQTILGLVRSMNDLEVEMQSVSCKQLPEL